MGVCFCNDVGGASYDNNRSIPQKMAKGDKIHYNNTSLLLSNEFLSSFIESNNVCICSSIASERDRPDQCRHKIADTNVKVWFTHLSFSEGDFFDREYDFLLKE